MTRTVLVGVAVMLAFGAGLAVAAALPPGPTVDVQVVPVAYGGDPQLGTQPDLFGLGVRQAHCSNGATGYAVAVDGATYELSCAATSRALARSVIVGLSPGHSYTVTIRAVQKRAGRSPRLGSTHKLTVQIPAADSKNWQANT